MGSDSLPKWQILEPEQPTSLYFGFTAPTVVVSALAILLCIFLEATGKLSRDQRAAEREQRMRRRHRKTSLCGHWPFITELIISHWSLPSRLLYGVLEIENELSYINM